MDPISKGNEAQRLLDSPVVRDALQSIKSEIIEQWSATPARDTEAREWVWRHYKVAEKFEAILRGYVETGKLERIRMEEKESFAAKAKRKFGIAA